MLYRHLKTGNFYRRLGKAIDVGRGRYGVLVVIYARDGADMPQLFVRHIDEFTEKFERHTRQDNDVRPWMLQHGPRFQHIASGHVYRQLGQGIDATNARDGMQVLIYCRDQEPSEIYVAPLHEFMANFAAIP